MRFTTVVFILSCTLLLVQGQKSSYGEPCSKSQRCDRRSWLGCSAEGKCDCLKPDEMLYDPEAKKCVSKAGERCKFALENAEGAAVFEVSHCVANAKCGPDGFCLCHEEHRETGDGSCSPAPKYSEPCDEGNKCSEKLGLECEDRVCRCRGNSSVFSEVENQCLGLVDSECVKGKCTESAFCAKSGKCRCREGYFQDWENKCSPKQGLFSNCSHDEHCISRGNMPLKCIDNICTCDPEVSILEGGRNNSLKRVGKQIRFGVTGGAGGESIFYGLYPSSETVTRNNNHNNNEFLQAKCVGKSNAPCIEGRCVRGASCKSEVLLGVSQPKSNKQQQLSPVVKKHIGLGGINFWTTHSLDDEYGYGLHSTSSSSEELLTPVHVEKHTCLCNPGHVSLASGQCGRPYDAPCDEGTCLEGLVCKGRRCSCRYPHQIFYPTEGKCKARVRGPCQKDEDCIFNSVCRIANNSTATGQCSCREGHVENMRRECDIEHTGDCTNNADCDSIARLSCIEGKCDCDGFARFDPGVRRCLSLVGGDCTAQANSSNCVENAYCKVIHVGFETGPGTCDCNQGFVVGQDYTCE